MAISATEFFFQATQVIVSLVITLVTFKISNLLIYYISFVADIKVTLNVIEFCQNDSFAVRVFFASNSMSIFVDVFCPKSSFWDSNFEV